MYLKRIELIGFKSFPNKTKISFEPGISCIVGPNGSGKSNIADALRWVLGEQSARSLRGGKLEDVIFSGSKKRRPLGMAEVSVILDNSDGYLPYPFTEISVSRRALRNGGSEYQINDKPCRLKDVRDLFVDTGIGTEGLSLINQGRIHELVTARPEERRVLVEEAAGIVKYRDRKREALRRLAETERHLERVGDIIHELADRVGPLQAQSEKAQHFLLLKEEADRLEMGISVKVLSEADEKLCELDQKLAEQNDILLQNESARLSAAAEAEQLRAAIAAMDEEVTAANDAYYRLQAEREKAEGERRIAETQRANSAAAAERLRQALAQFETQLQAKRDAATEMAAHIERTENELAAQEEEIRSGEGGSSDLRAYAAQLSGRLGELNSRAAMLASERTAAEQKSRFRAELCEKNAAAAAALTAEAEQLAAEQAALAAQVAELTALLEKLAVESRRQSAAVNEGETLMRQLSLAVQELSAEEADCRFRCHSQQTKVHMLAEMAAGYEGFFPGVKGLLAARREGKAPAGIVGVIAELMDVPPQYRVAVEAYLGANLQNIVCEDANAAQAAVAYLKKNRLGRATFLPLDIIRPREAQDIARAEQLRGVHGRASDLVAVAEPLRPAVEFLLNNVLLVEDMDVALAAAKALRYRVSVVTLDGDMVNPGASISGGSRSARAGELLSKKSRLEDAEKELQTLEQELAEHTARLSAQRSKAEEATAAHAAARERLQRCSEQVRTTTQEREQLLYRQDAAAAREQVLATEREKLRQEAEALSTDAEDAGAEAARLQDEEEALQAALQELQQQTAEVEESLASSREDVTEKKMQLAAQQQKLHGQRISLERLEQEAVDLSWEAEEAAADLAQAEEAEQRHGEAFTAAGGQLTQINLALHDAAEKLELSRHGMAAESARLHELEKADRDALREQEKLRETIHGLQLRRERWQADFENESARLREKFAVSLEQARVQVGEMQGRTVMQQRLGQLKREIAALGNVNLDAITEYGEVDTRYRFLQAQREDLQTARSRLDTVIHEMDTVMTSRFRETFGRLSDAFGVCFRRLFGGGQAELRLSAPEDILETGVELNVSLPGKRVANYNLLSGGEKALIGIALMFAMLTVRPTPFCVMDEVDAALDEANIDRFTAFLQDKAADSQFVMISHRQSTMEAADALWGVTMEEEGVSKVIGVRLTAAGAEPAAEE